MTQEGLEIYMKRNTKLELIVHELLDLISRIDTAFNRYNDYLEYRESLERLTLESFALSVIEDGSSSVKGIVPRIHGLVMGPSSADFRVLGNRGLLELIAEDLEVSFCSFFRIFMSLETKNLLWNLPLVLTILETEAFKVNILTKNLKKCLKPTATNQTQHKYQME